MSWEPTGGAVVRAPLLSFETLALLGERGGLESVVTRPEVREAIFLASPSLESRVDAWLAGSDPDGSATRRALLAYVVRMSTRPTPFGLFASVAAATIGPRTALDVGSLDGAVRHTRVDFGALTRIASVVEHDPDARRALTWVRNSSLYAAGSRLRLAEAADTEKGRRYHRVTFEPDAPLLATVARADRGAALPDLAAALVDDEVTPADAAAFIDELVEAQVLVSELEPALTGDEPTTRLIDQLRATPPAAAYADALAGAVDGIAKLDISGIGAPPALYRSLAAPLLDRVEGLELARLFQLDLVRAGAPLAIGRTVLREAQRAIDLLAALTPAPGETDLTRWCEAFTQRYEDRFVPLTIALDEELGVVYGGGPGIVAEGAPLLDGMPAVASAGPSGAAWTAGDQVRAALLMRALRKGNMTVELTDEDCRALAGGGSGSELPDALALFCVVAAPSVADVDAGRFSLFAHALGGPSGARMLGRFAHADPDIATITAAHLRAEEALVPDAAWAEVVHLPEGRTGNILCRPVLRSYEIPFLGRSGAPPDAQLPLGDLLVGIVGGRPVLMSQRLGREVIPRLSAAHNTARGALAPYRFLSDLQSFGVRPGVMWDWGPAGEVAPFTPRVTHGRVVLARASWRVTRSEVAEGVDRLRSEHGLPRWCAVTQADHELVLDLEQHWAAELLTHEAGRSGLRLVELFPSPEELCASGPEGRFTHELLIPFVRSGVGRTSPRLPSSGTVRRDFPPGSEWVTARLVTSRATADAVLRELVAPLVSSLDGASDRWFFVRYADPEWHLRLRVHGDAAIIVPALHDQAQALLEDGRIARLQLDTYRREVARYGGPAGIELSERLWHEDSQRCLDLFVATDPDRLGSVRWRAALVTVDRLLVGLRYALEERRRIVRVWRDGLARSVGPTGTVARQHAGGLYRTHRESISREVGGDDQPWSAVLDEAVELSQSGELTAPLDEIASSWAHMHVNRMLRAAHRVQELVLYDLLDRSYSAAIGRGRA